MEKVAYFETAATDVRNKVDKRKGHRDCAVGGLGCEEQRFNDVPLSFAKFCALSPLHGNIESVQLLDKARSITIVFIYMPTYPKPTIYPNSGPFLHRLLCTSLTVWGWG